jgi:hypothetical protein
MRYLALMLLALQGAYAYSQSVFFTEARASVMTEVNESPEITVVQINAEWNSVNTREDLERLRGCDYKFGWLEDMPDNIRRTIISVPIVVIYKDGSAAYQWVSDISLSLKTPFQEIQDTIYMLSQ